MTPAVKLTPATITTLVPLARQEYQQLLASLDEVQQGIIADLPNQTEEESLQTRLAARELSRTSWVIECAVDAQTVNRAHAKRGRGNIDTLGVGVTAAVARRAKSIGCTPRTITKNAQVFRLLCACGEAMNATSQNAVLATLVLPEAILPDKHFYVAALSAADPLAAVREFITKSGNSHRFRVSDAYRLLAAEGKTKSQVTAVAAAASRTPESSLLLTHLIQARDTLRELIATCPNAELAQEIYAECLDNIEDALAECFDEDVLAALGRAYDKGHRREDAMVAETGFPLEVVSRIMGRYAEEGLYIEVPQPGVNGSPRLWHRVGEPLPQELRAR